MKQWTMYIKQTTLER